MCAVHSGVPGEACSLSGWRDTFEWPHFFLCFFFFFFCFLLLLPRRSPQGFWVRGWWGGMDKKGAGRGGVYSSIEALPKNRHSSQSLLSATLQALHLEVILQTCAKATEAKVDWKEQPVPRALEVLELRSVLPRPRYHLCPDTSTECAARLPWGCTGRMKGPEQNFKLCFKVRSDPWPLLCLGIRK